MTAPAVAFIGLGLMGRPLAFHLRKAGHPLKVYNRSAAKSEGFAAAGAQVCGSPAQAAAGSRIVFLCVGDAPDVREVLLGPGGVAEGAQPGTLVVDHSTIAPVAAQQLERDCRARGLRFLDAPLSGGQVGAIEGRVNIMCGGTEADFEEARAVMQCYGKKITRVGESGMGQVAKACNQVLVGVGILAVAEALNLAEALGADPAKVHAAVQGGAASSWSLDVLGPKMLAGDDRAGFYVKHQVKDLRIVLDEAARTRAAVPGTALARELYKAVQARGGEHCGNHTLYRALQMLSGKDWSPAAGPGAEPA